MAEVTDRLERVRAIVAGIGEDLVRLRRDLHAHPEVGFDEHRTTAVLVRALREAGLEPRELEPTGLVVDIGAGPGRIMLRADIDALPLAEETGETFTSTVPGVSHACGHDLHSAIGIGTALVLAELAETGEFEGAVRLLFQPAEDVQPGGAQHVMEQGVLDGVEAAFALHCDPRVTVGSVGMRAGPITAASDTLRVTVRSEGGHTSRPHLTGDVVNALGQVITQTGAVLGRRVDARSGTNLTWGAVHAGSAPNAIPTEGYVYGTLRTLDAATWATAGPLAAEAVEAVLAPYGVDTTVEHVRGLPPVVNTPREAELLRRVALEALGAEHVLPTEQSLGGEDFAWFLTRVPGAMFRLGTRTPGGPEFDLHRGDARFDEGAIGVGTLLMALTAIEAASSAS